MSLVSSLASLEGCLSADATDRATCLDLMKLVFTSLALLLSASPANRAYFRDSNGTFPLHFMTHARTHPCAPVSSLTTRKRYIRVHGSRGGNQAHRRSQHAQRMGGGSLFLRLVRVSAASSVAAIWRGTANHEELELPLHLPL
jgi:hypothetical protein